MRYAMPLIVFLTACHSPQFIPSSVSSAGQYASHSMSGGMDPVLSWVGGVATIAGIIALVITRGSLGARAVFIGVGLVLLNQIIARYSDWLFLPVLIATGAVSLTYGYRTIQQVLKRRKGDVS